MKLVKGLTVLLLFVFVFALFYRPLEVEDNWWHLAVGKWMATHHSVPIQDPFPYFQDPAPWQHVHWLGSFLFYKIHELSGVDGLKLFRALFFVLVVAIFFFAYRKRLPFGLLLCLSVLLSYGLASRFMLRPDIFNFLFVQLSLVLLLSSQRGGNCRLLYFFPLLGAVWFNFHLGAFVYGPVIFGIFMLSEIVRGASLDEGERNKKYRNLALLGGTFFLFLSSFALGPFGLKGLSSAFEMFSRSSSIFHQTFNHIQEIASPNIFKSKYLWFWLYLALGLLFFMRRQSFRSVLLFLVPAGMFLYVSRNSGFFAVMAAYALAEIAREQPDEQRRSGIGSPATFRAVTAALIAVMAFQVWDVATRKISINGEVRLKALAPLDSVDLVDASNFLRSNGIHGRVFNSEILYGNLIIWSGYPGLRPITDGRNIYPERFMDVLKALAAPAEYWPFIEKTYSPDIVMAYANGSANRLVEYIDQRPDWQLVFVEGSSFVYVKKGAFKLSDDLQTYQARMREKSITAGDIEELHKLYEESGASDLRQIVNPAPYSVMDWDTGVTLLEAGYLAAGVEKVLSGAKQGDVRTRRNLAAVISFLKNHAVTAGP